MKQTSAGYQYFIEKYRLEVIPNWHRSYIWKESQTRHKKENNHSIEEVYPARYRPGIESGEQLEFALKYDGVNLAILLKIFSAIDTKELVTYISSKPTGKYTRRIWFLYEFLTGKKLSLADIEQGNYIDLLEADRYYTLAKGELIRRQRIRNNLPGTKAFCPIVMRTLLLQRMEEEDLVQQCRDLFVDYPPEILNRALAYLYTKETKSSFFIEHEELSTTRTERFATLLQEAEKEDFCQKERLLELQNRIVDERFAESDYRMNQNYVGETVTLGQEKIHYIPPRPEDIGEMMEGLVASHKRMREGSVHPVVHAAMIAYGFVFLHPFEDGNGRIHRFLIHNILALEGFAPQGVIFPVSAVMLKEAAAYDASLEAFSSKIVPMIDYAIDNEGRMRVYSDTAIWYRYMDMTPQSEALYCFVKETIEKELPNELAFLSGYDKTKKALKEIVDIPDRLIDLFIRFVLQNHGKLSRKKKVRYFATLTDEEIEEMEDVVMGNLS